MFKKKKKKETAEELKAKLEELEDEPEVGEEGLDILPEPPKPPKNLKVAKVEPKGEFSLNMDEMSLAVNALANSEEFKLYQQMVIGEQAAKIIAAYNKAVGGESGVQEDTEEKLPTE